jgi:ABC-type Zn uptake system ZnuABC Zn-binding protein ZnuA
MTVGKGLFIFIVLGLFSTLSASGTEMLKVVTFSTVLTEAAEQVGGQHVSRLSKTWARPSRVPADP